MMDNSNVKTIKETAATRDNLEKKSSIPFFLPNMVSAPPEIEPDKPALLPDCKRTVAISAIDEITCNAMMAVRKEDTPSLKSTTIFYHNAYCDTTFIENNSSLLAKKTEP